MANTASTLTELDDLAKDYYTNYWAPQMAQGKPLKAQLDQCEEWEFSGREMVFGLKLETGGGAANAGSGKTLPENADGKYDQARVSTVRTYVRLALDLHAAEISKSKKGSFKPFLEEKIDDRMKAMTNEVNRQMFCAGDGKLAVTGSGTASATQTLTLAYGVTNGGNPARHIFQGDQLAFFQSDATPIGTRKVSSVTATLGGASASVVLASTITSTTDGFVSKATADTTNYDATEANGLLAAFTQSGNFQNVPVAGNYSAVKLTNSGTLRDVSDNVVMTGFSAVQALTDEAPNLIVTRPGIVQKYSEVFLPIRRIDGQDVKLKGGYRPLSVFQHAGGEAPILTDVDCPGARLFGLNTSYIKKIDMVGEQWADKDGAFLNRITDQDGVEGYMRKYWQLAWQRLNCHFLIEDLNDVATADRVRA